MPADKRFTEITLKKKFKEFVSTFERQFDETFYENWFELSYSYIFWSLV
jgi:hypothetical protein